MSVCLLDVNTLVALLWTNHEQHDAARAWFLAHKRAGWATCPLTQTGFIRVSSNPRVFPDAPSPGKAAEILAANLGHANHHFWKDEIPFARAVAPFGAGLLGHQQVTDAYLLGLAIRKRGVLATFDAVPPCSIRSRRRSPWQSSRREERLVKTRASVAVQCGDSYLGLCNMFTVLWLALWLAGLQLGPAPRPDTGPSRGQSKAW